MAATTTMEPNRSTGNRSLYWGLAIALVIVLAVAWAMNNFRGRSSDMVNPPRTTAPEMNTAPGTDTNTNMNTAPVEPAPGTTQPGANDTNQPANPPANQ